MVTASASQLVDTVSISLPSRTKRLQKMTKFLCWTLSIEVKKNSGQVGVSCAWKRHLTEHLTFMRQIDGGAEQSAQSN